MFLVSQYKILISIYYNKAAHHLLSVEVKTCYYRTKYKKNHMYLDH